MITDELKKEVASIAIIEIEAGGGPKIAGDRRLMAEMYAQAAYDTLEEEGSGYDPLLHKPVLAKKAAIEYVKAALSGPNPDAAAGYVLARRNWKDKAAKQVKRAEFNALEG